MRGVGGNPLPLPDTPPVRCWALLLGGIPIERDVEWPGAPDTTINLPLSVLKPAKSLIAGVDVVWEIEIGGES
jgi:hypothetical protein